MNYQKTNHCVSCPWVKNGDRSCYFPPDVLERTIVDNHQAERIHYCHSQAEKFCTGYLAYLKTSDPDFARNHALARVAIHFGFLDPAAIPELEVFETIPQMLADHQQRQANDLFNH